MIISLVKNLRKRTCKINICASGNFFRRKKIFSPKNQRRLLLPAWLISMFRHRATFFFFNSALSALSNVLPRYTTQRLCPAALSDPTVVKKNCKRRRAKTILRFIFLLTYQRVIYAIGAIYA